VRRVHVQLTRRRLVSRQHGLLSRPSTSDLRRTFRLWGSLGWCASRSSSHAHPHRPWIGEFPAPEPADFLAGPLWMPGARPKWSTTFTTDM
jgi:hypothetical protein